MHILMSFIHLKQSRIYDLPSKDNFNNIITHKLQKYTANTHTHYCTKLRDLQRIYMCVPLENSLSKATHTCMLDNN